MELDHTIKYAVYLNTCDLKVGQMFHSTIYFILFDRVQFDVQTHIIKVLQFCSVTRILLIKIINNCLTTALALYIHHIYDYYYYGCCCYSCVSLTFVQNNCSGTNKRGIAISLCEGEIANFHTHVVAALSSSSLTSLLLNIFEKNLS